MNADPGSGAAGALTPRVARLAALLEEMRRSTVTLAELWGLWATADPTSVGNPDRRAALARAIRELAAVELVTPSKRQDTTASPHLPTQLALPKPAPSPAVAELARSVAWRPELAWVPRAKPTIGQVERLRQINTWLRDRGRDSDVLPLRERSLEVLGHEKVLDKLIGTSLFAEGRLSFELLRTFRTHPPLPAIRVGDGPVLLVVENEDTFHSVRTVAAERPGAIGFVAWGAGGAFEASVRSCGELRGISRVRYFGDVDADGLRIPRNAAITAADEQLPEVRLAGDLYRALLATGIRQGHQPVLTAEQVAAVVGWLDDPQLAADLAEVLRGSSRIPQEALTMTRLLALTGWTDNL